jgi:hypothetical protein
MMLSLEFNCFTAHPYTIHKVRLVYEAVKGTKNIIPPYGAVAIKKVSSEKVLFLIDSTVLTTFWKQAEIKQQIKYTSIILVTFSHVWLSVGPPSIL